LASTSSVFDCAIGPPRILIVDCFYPTCPGFSTSSVLVCRPCDWHISDWFSFLWCREQWYCVQHCLFEHDSFVWEKIKLCSYSWGLYLHWLCHWTSSDIDCGLLLSNMSWIPYPYSWTWMLWLYLPCRTEWNWSHHSCCLPVCFWACTHYFNHINSCDLLCCAQVQGRTEGWATLGEQPPVRPRWGESGTQYRQPIVDLTTHLPAHPKTLLHAHLLYYIPIMHVI
jgi:hypothetical protein